MIFSLVIFSRSGACLFHERWNAAATKAAVTYADPEEEKRLLFGLIFSLKEFVFKVTPTTGDSSDGAASAALPSEGLQRYQTNTYTCHHYETPSGLRFILMTDNHAGDLSSVLKHLYAHHYVEYVVNNPLSDVQNAKAITSQLFRAQIKQYIEGLASFR